MARARCGAGEASSGRKWRSLTDTSISAQILYGARDDYSLLRRGVDFYSEGALVWLEADTLIRNLSHGSKSLDDFCRAFFGASDATTSGGEALNPYTRESLVATLNAVQPYDWNGFFEQRVDSTASRTLRAGIVNAGWKLAFGEKRTDVWTASEEDRKTADLVFSLGMIVKADGSVKDVTIGSPAQKAGVAPGSTITYIGARAFSLDSLRDAINAATALDDPIDITVKKCGHHENVHTGIPRRRKVSSLGTRRQEAGSDLRNCEAAYKVLAAADVAHAPTRAASRFSGRLAGFLK